MTLMNSQLFVVVLCSLCLGAHAQSSEENAKAGERLRHVVLASRHLGAHGLGYNEQSLNILSRTLTSADIPGLIDLSADTDLHVGVQFALASQCETAIVPVRDAAVQHKMTFLDAEDTMRQIEDYSACGAETHRKAADMRSEIHSLEEADARRLQQEAREKAIEDARIQRNALKSMDSKQASTLTLQEREEVFRRSLKAMGLKEDGPMTPTQKDLVQRMYRTMVLGEPGDRPSN